MRLTSSARVPGRTASTNDTGSSTSATMTSGVPAARLSRVADTPPSTEFSIGTSPDSISPARTASSTRATVAKGVDSASVSVRRAWWVNVPAGPKYPITRVSLGSRTPQLPDFLPPGRGAGIRRTNGGPTLPPAGVPDAAAARSARGPLTSSPRKPLSTKDAVGHCRFVDQNQETITPSTNHWTPELMTSRIVNATTSTMKSEKPTVRPVT